MTRARPKGLFFALFVFLLLTTCRLGFSQTITADILGTVTDSTGAVVPGAKITLTAVDTSIKLEATSNASGDYLFAQMKPGHYSLVVSKEGFQTYTLTDITLQVGQRPRVDVALQIGAVTQTIEVSAGGVQLLETQTSTVGKVIDNRVVTELPLNGRNFISLMVTTAGVAPLLNGVAEASFWTGQAMISNSVAGLRESNESFLVDGIESRSARFGGVGMRPQVDAIQEFKMQTSNFSAEFGRSSAVINTTLKSGTNVIHGTGFEFIQGQQLDANNFFNNLSGTPKPLTKQNDFGGVLGGPLVLPHLYNGRDKTFWFLGYEGIRYRQGASNKGTVPSAAQLQGNLADDSAGTGIYPTSSAFCTTTHPGSAKCVNVLDPTTGLAFANNLIPSGRLDPFVQKWAPFWVAPNVAVTPGQATTPIYNVINNPNIRNDMNQANARMDHALSSRDNIFGSFSFEDRPHDSPGLMPTQGLYYPYRNQLLSVTQTFTFSPTVVNELRFGYNRAKTYLLSLGANHTNYAVTVFDLKNTSQNPFDAGAPGAGITGFSGPGSFSESIGSLDEDYQIVDSLSVVRGKHNIKMGENFIHEKFFEITDFAGVPSFSFQGKYTGTGLGDYLLGAPYSGTTSVGDSHQNLRSNYWAVYLQDDWRVTPELTLNMGGRYEHMQKPYDTENRTEWFDPTAINPTTNTPGTVVESPSGGVRNGIVDPNWWDFSPRFGFAYSPKFLKNTVIRSSYGVFWASDVWNDLQFLVVGPYFYSSQTITSDPVHPTINLSNMFPPGGLGGTSGNPFSVDKRFHDPYVQEWTFDVQHNFASNWLIDVAYVGNVGQKLRIRQDQNYRTSYDPTGTIPYQEAVPYPNYSWILTDMSKGWSSYNGLLAKVEKRFSNGVSMSANYTWSHALDLSEGDEGPYSGIHTEQKGNMTYDVRNRFVLTYAYQFPFGKGKHFGGGVSGPMDKVIGGWQVTGITTFATGQWVPITLPSNWANNGSWGTNRPNRIASAIPSNRNYLNYWNINSFEYPGCDPSYNSHIADCTTGLHIVGNAGRNSYEVPGINNWDFSLMKDTKINEKFNTQFRAEFFNGWNHTQFSTPSDSLNPTSFGRIGGTLIGARTVQFGLRILF